MIAKLIRSIRKRLAFLFPHKTVVRNGITYRLDCREVIDNAIYLDTWESDTLAFIDEFVKPGQTVLEIGANIGAHTMLLARAVGPEGRVYSVEPTEYARAKLNNNIALNPELKDRITVLNYLVTHHSDEELRREIKASWRFAHYFRERDEEVVSSPSISIDDMVARYEIGDIDILKIDIDGYDYKALLGAITTLENSHPLVFVELCEWAQRSCGHSIAEIFSFLEQRGYCGANAVGMTPLSTDDALAIVGEAGSINGVFRVNAS